jgi:hypothetical protein
MISLHVTQKELENTQGSGGVEIHIEGIVGDPDYLSDIPIFIEKYEGKVRVIIWNGSDQPIVHELTPASPPQEEAKPTTPCPGCGADLSQKKSVSRNYYNKDGGEPRVGLGHLENGEYEPDTHVDLSDGRFDLLDGSDACMDCGGVL